MNQDRGVSYYEFFERQCSGARDTLDIIILHSDSCKVFLEGIQINRAAIGSKAKISKSEICLIIKRNLNRRFSASRRRK